jgi:hypothetical protein
MDSDSGSTSNPTSGQQFERLDVCGPHHVEVAMIQGCQYRELKSFPSGND